jgi:methylated-DNA-[protein]-cysteine S-methyltransferase
MTIPMAGDEATKGRPSAALSTQDSAPKTYMRTVKRKKGAKQPSYERQIKAGQILDGMNFCQKVWALTARIPKGQITTYAEIARFLGTRGCRAVGAALNRNPYSPKVPCHRVVGATGRLVGFANGLPTKRKLLKAEGVLFHRKHVNMTNIYRFE